MLAIIANEIIQRRKFTGTYYITNQDFHEEVKLLNHMVPSNTASKSRNTGVENNRRRNEKNWLKEANNQKYFTLTRLEEEMEIINILNTPYELSSY